jgi:endonuclease/exonuclease/phosphatase family metal-dependent hydrolase
MKQYRQFIPLLMAVFCLHAEKLAAQDTITVLTHNVLAFSGHPRDTHPTDSVVFRKAVDFYRQTRADILILQEAPPESTIRKLAVELNYACAYFTPKYAGDAVYPYGFPGCILSRFEISSSTDYNRAFPDMPDTLFQRHLGEVILRTPRGALQVIGLHLCADWGNTFRESTRLAELDYLFSRLVICDTCTATLAAGDFNSRPMSRPYVRMIEAGFSDTQENTGEATVPVPDSRVRIDYIFLSGNHPRISSFAVPVRVPLLEENGLYLSDHQPCITRIVIH